MARLGELLLWIANLLLSAYLIGALLVAATIVGGFAIAWCALR